jgi:DNA-binding CsgD family transcriptional regulator
VRSNFYSKVFPANTGINTDESVFFSNIESSILYLDLLEIKTAIYEDYSLFFKFFVTHSQWYFKNIKHDDPLLMELDSYMDRYTQLFYIADPVLLDIKFISKGVKPMFGIDQDAVTPGFFLTTTHQDDLKRHQLARTKLFSVAQDIFIQKSGTCIISSNFRGRNPEEGGYTDHLYQCFLFYSKIPYESTFLILVITDVSRFEHIHKGFHYYIGNDPKVFRFPDEELLSKGNIFSHTEFRIIELIEEGLSTKEIAEKLFRSPLTINTHRSNIIEKSGKSSITEVIRELKAKGLL